MTIEYGDVLHTIFGQTGQVIGFTNAGDPILRTEDGKKLTISRKYIDLLVKADD